MNARAVLKENFAGRMSTRFSLVSVLQYTSGDSLIKMKIQDLKKSYLESNLGYGRGTRCGEGELCRT